MSWGDFLIEVITWIKKDRLNDILAMMKTYEIEEIKKPGLHIKRESLKIKQNEFEQEMEERRVQMEGISKARGV